MIKVSQSLYRIKVLIKAAKAISLNLLPLTRQILIMRLNKIFKCDTNLIKVLNFESDHYRFEEILKTNWTGANHTDKYDHGYAKLYSNLLESMGDGKFNMIEFGIGGNGPNPVVPPGSSLRTWKNAHENIQLFGFDIDPRNMLNEARIKTMVMDQTKITDIIKLMSLIPTIQNSKELWLDDALHEPSGFMPVIRVALETSKPLVIAIEDLWAPYFIFLFCYFKIFYPSEKFSFVSCHISSKPMIVKKLSRVIKIRGWSNVLVFTN